MSIAYNIKRLRESHDLTQTEFGEIAGVTDKAVSSWETGAKTPRMGAIQKIADYFHINKSDIIEDELYDNDSIAGQFDNIRPIHLKRFPLVGEIACGKPILAQEEKEAYVMADMDIVADFCLIAKGDSMINARIRNGDIVFIKQMEMVENGDIAAVIIDDEATLKRVYYYPKKNKLVLNPENPAFEPLVYLNEELNEIRILGKAVYFMSAI